MKKHLRFLFAAFCLFSLALGCNMENGPTSPPNGTEPTPTPTPDPFPHGFDHGPTLDIKDYTNVAWVFSQEGAENPVALTDEGLVWMRWFVGPLWDRLEVGGRFQQTTFNTIWAPSQNPVSNEQLISGAVRNPGYRIYLKDETYTEHLLADNIFSIALAPTLYPKTDAKAFVVREVPGNLPKLKIFDREQKLVEDKTLLKDYEYRILLWAWSGLVMSQTGEGLFKVSVLWPDGHLHEYSQQFNEEIFGAVENGSGRFLVSTASGIKLLEEHKFEIGETVIKPGPCSFKGVSRKDKIVAISHTQKNDLTQDAVSFYVPDGAGYKKVAGIGWHSRPVHGYYAVFSPDGQYLIGVFSGITGGFLQIFKVKEDGSLIASSEPRFFGQARDEQKVIAFQGALKIHGQIAAF